MVQSFQAKHKTAAIGEKTVEKERRQVLCSRSSIDSAVGGGTEQSNLYEELSDRASKYHLYIDHGSGHSSVGSSPVASCATDLWLQYESDIK